MDHRGQVKLLCGFDAERNDPKDDPNGSALLKHIDTKATETRDAICEVGFTTLFETRLLYRAHDRRRNVGQLVGHHAFAVFERYQCAVHAKHWRQPGLQVNV